MGSRRRGMRWSIPIAGVAAAGLLAIPAGAAPTTPSPATTHPAARATSTLVPAATSYAATMAAGRADARALLKSTGASSLSLALTDNGHILWRESFGAIDTHRTLPKIDTVYGLGSVTKVITAMAIMQLVDAHKVSLDAPITNYIHEFTMADPAYRQITVRMLLNHTAGFPGTDYANAFATTPYAGYASQVLRTLRTARLKTTPGSMAVYCNDCFTLAGIVVERMSGMAYANYVRDSIFTPLGMSHSGFVTALPPAFTFARILGPSGTTLEPLEVTNVLASGGAFSTPTDMSRMAMMLMNGGVFHGRRLLSAASVAEMGRSQMGTTFEPSAHPFFVYGLGWDDAAQPGLAAVNVPAWLKGGDTDDFHAGFIVAPTAKLGVIVQSTGKRIQSNDVEALGEKIMLHALVDQKKLRAMPTRLGGTTLPVRTPTSGQLAAIKGIYLSQGANVRVAEVAGHRLTVSVLIAGKWIQQPGVFVQHTDGKFWSTSQPANYVSTVTGWGRRYLVATTPRGWGHYRLDQLLGQKVAPTTALSPAWQARVGKRWLVVDEIPGSTIWAAPFTTLTTVPLLPGYLIGTGGLVVDPHASNTVASAFLVIPTANGRDQDDISMFTRGGHEWMTAAGHPRMPQSAVLALTAGPNPVVTGPEGYAEWRHVVAASNLAVHGASEWKLFGSDLTLLDSGSGAASGIQAPAGSFLVIFAAAGHTSTVTVS